jgi:hypothetical protein
VTLEAAAPAASAAAAAAAAATAVKVVEAAVVVTAVAWAAAAGVATSANGFAESGAEVLFYVLSKRDLRSWFMQLRVIPELQPMLGVIGPWMRTRNTMETSCSCRARFGASSMPFIGNTISSFMVEIG